MVVLSNTKKPPAVPREKVEAFQSGLLRWFCDRGRVFPWRKKGLSNYKRILSEVLLQRTRAETVATFFENFARAFPGWRSLASAGDEELEKHLRPIGLWRRRAASLKALAVTMAKRNGRFPSTREEIEALPGVGQYIANSILLFCHGESQPLIDVNMSRVLERYFGPRALADIRHDPYLQSLSIKVLESVNPVTMNWAILDFAAIVCKARRPSCGTCPLNGDCLFYGGQVNAPQ